MIQREVSIRNRAGLHTRPAASLVKLAAKYKAEFFIEKDGLEINGKSIIGVMTLAAEQGSKLLIRFSGEDEEEASKAVVDLIERGFDEKYTAVLNDPVGDFRSRFFKTTSARERRQFSKSRNSPQGDPGISGHRHRSGVCVRQARSRYRGTLHSAGRSEP
jgi:phosphocarrier protein